MSVIDRTLPLALTSGALTPEAASFLQRQNIGAAHTRSSEPRRQRAAGLPKAVVEAAPCPWLVARPSSERCPVYHVPTPTPPTLTLTPHSQMS
jgi:hypothetical protein